MAKQSFSSGQTLTAQQMNDLQANDYNLSVSTQTANYTLVAADKGTREVANAGSAITFTVPNNVFAAGDIVDIHNINTGLLTLAAGTGMTLSSADVLTVNQWQGGTLYFTSASASIWFPRAKTVSAGGLVYITGASFTTASSVNLPDNTFSSTYRNYIVQIDVTAVSTTLNVLMQGRTAGSTDTASVYYWANQTLSYVPTESNVGSTAATTSCRILTTAAGGGISLTFYAPQVSTTPFIYTGLYWDINTATSAAIGGGTYTTTKQYDALTLSTSTGTMTGVYRVYGLADS